LRSPEDRRSGALGSHGLRLVATPNPRLELLVRDEHDQPVEQFSVFSSWMVGARGEQTGDCSGHDRQANGSAIVFPMPRGISLFAVIPLHRALTCRAVRLDADRIPSGPLEVHLEALCPFAARVPAR